MRVTSLWVHDSPDCPLLEKLDIWATFSTVWFVFLGLRQNGWGFTKYMEVQFPF